MRTLKESRSRVHSANIASYSRYALMRSASWVSGGELKFPVLMTPAVLGVRACASRDCGWKHVIRVNLSNAHFAWRALARCRMGAVVCVLAGRSHYACVDLYAFRPISVDADLDGSLPTVLLVRHLDGLRGSRCLAAAFLFLVFLRYLALVGQDDCPVARGPCCRSLRIIFFLYSDNVEVT